MNVARINMSHAKESQVREMVATIRDISAKTNKPIAILMDAQGPAIRTGDVASPLNLKPGDTIALTVRGSRSEEQFSVDVNYDDLVDDIQVDDVVLVDNGDIQLRVLNKNKNQLRCEVLTEGTLGSRRHINLPGIRVNLPALTEKDIKDIELGIELGVDFFAMSFVREAEDVMKLKNILDYRKAPQEVIAKLEDQEGVKNLEEIIDAADGVMVARGDLGIEVPYEELPIIQRRIVKSCVKKGKRVIVATHMLESMVENPSPTRAEITDVANAVFEEPDAIMLSGETSVGAYPIKCVEIMDRIARRIERSGGAGYSQDVKMDSKYAKLVKSAILLAKETEAKALIVFTHLGSMARNASWLRPADTPLFAFTPTETLPCQLNLYWGVHPVLMKLGEDNAKNVEDAIDHLLKHGFVEKGDNVVIVTEWRIREKLIDIIQMEEAG